MSRAAGLACAAALAAAALVSCHRGPAVEGEAAPEPAADALRKTSSDGPVEATVEVWPPRPLLGDPIHLRLSVKAKAGVSVEMPPWGDALGRFQIVGRFEPTERRDAQDGSATYAQDYALQAPMSGKQRIPPLRVEWTDRARAAADAGAAAVPPAAKELWTEEVPLEIGTNLPAGALALRDPAGPLDPHVGGLPLWGWLAAGLILAAAAAGFFLTRAWRRRAAVQAKVSAYDVAMARLAALDQAGAPDGAVADAWYVELSSVVRRYLEDRYGVRAPELTTEEFLLEAQRMAALSAPHRDMLSAFLAGCDRVKFAGHHPEATESRGALAQARAFIEDTRLVVAPAGGGA
jgi:hypothetical protein